VSQPTRTIRTAQPADIDDLRALCEMAGTIMEDEIVQAIRSGTAGAALQAGLDGGFDGLFDHIQQNLLNPPVDDLKELFLRLTLALVAEDEQGRVVGAALASPPVRVIMAVAQELQTHGATQNQWFQGVLMGSLGICRIRAVAVHEPYRRMGAGAALVQSIRSTYTEIGYSIIYGQMPLTEGLDDFYREQGFRVLSVGEVFDARVVFGNSVGISTEDTQRLFVWQDPTA
jgi:predicted N-acetyltransferase YhbS